MKSYKMWGIRFGLIVLSIMFLLPKSVYAASAVELVGSDLSSPGETVSYDIILKPDSTVIGYSTELTYDSTVLEVISIENKANWKGSNSTGSSPISLSFTHASGISGNSIAVATITFKVKTNVYKSLAKIELTGNSLTMQDTGSSATVEPVTKELAIKSKDNSLKSLKLNEKPVTNFNPETYNYAVQIDSSVQKVYIDATLNDKTAKFVEGYESRSVDVDYGENDFAIKVVSESGLEKVYTITITRIDTRANNNNLKNIIINNGKIKLNFDKDTLEYSIKTYRLEKIEVDAVTEDPKATIEIDIPEKLVFGKNIVTITVTSESSVQKSYKVIIDNVDQQIDTSLTLLQITGYDINFDKDTFDYEIRYNSQYKNGLEIIKKATMSEKDGVKIDEALLEKTNANIKPGSKVEIRVYYDDDHESIYTITVVKDGRINFFLILGLLIIISLFVALMVLLKRRKNENIKSMIVSEEELMKTKEMKIDKKV